MGAAGNINIYAIPNGAKNKQARSHYACDSILAHGTQVLLYPVEKDIRLNKTFACQEKKKNLLAYRKETRFQCSK